MEIDLDEARALDLCVEDGLSDGSGAMEHHHYSNSPTSLYSMITSIQHVLRSGTYNLKSIPSPKELVLQFIMEISNKKITLEVHCNPFIKRHLTVSLGDKVSTLEALDPNVDFYLHGDKLALDTTFQDINLSPQTIIHTSDKGRAVFQFNPIYFKFLNGVILELPIPKVWTFKKTAEVIGASNGIDPSRISLIFCGRKMNPWRALMDEKNMAPSSTLVVVVNADLPSS